MTTNQSSTRFFKIFVPAMLVYIITTAGIAALSNNSNTSNYLLYSLTLLPTGAIFVAFWAQWRFALELDEFLRLIQIKGAFVGIAFVMIIASGWGQLERLTDVPRFEVFWMLPIFWSVQGLAITFISKREGVF
ncbi:MAG: hypothetical protein ABJO57_12665 [Lentilitoribacter sp.]